MAQQAGFIFGGSTNIKSPEELQRRRELVRAIQARNASRQPQDLWEGLNSFAESIGNAVSMKRLDKAETENQAKAAGAYDDLIKAMSQTGATVYPKAPQETSFGPIAVAGSAEAAKSSSTVPGSITNAVAAPAQPKSADPSQGSPFIDPRLFEVAGNPWLNGGQKMVVQALLNQELQKADPRNALELRKLQAEVGNIENPKMTPYQQAQMGLARAEAGRPDWQYFESNGDRYRYNSRDPNSKPEMFFDGPEKPVDPVKVGQGDTLLDPKSYQPIYQGQPKPTDDIAEYNFYVQQEKAAGRAPAPFSEYQTAVKRAGAMNINTGGGSDKQVFDAVNESAVAARGAVNGLAGIREAKKAVAGGIISGAYADERLALQKVGALLGVADPTKIVNTETFRAQIAPQVAAVMKATVGSTQISNADREFAQQAAGGSINLDGKSIARLLDIMERAGTVIVQGHTDRVNKVYPEGKGFDRERAIFGVDGLPPEPAPPPNQRIRVDRNGRPL